MNQIRHRPIAIIGAGAVLPGAKDVRSFWHNVTEGLCSISEVSADRWDPSLYYDPDPRAPDKTYTKIGGWVREYDWEPLKWRLPMPPRVSKEMDLTQRWAVVATREALADCGYPDRSFDPNRTAVILGNAMSGDRHLMTALRVLYPEYRQELLTVPSFQQLDERVQQTINRELTEAVGVRLPEITEDTMPGELANIIAGRIAAIYDFHGPNYVVDAACASAMAAITAASGGLVRGDYDTVITGGIDSNMSASSFTKFCKIGALSANGSYPYDQRADGFVMGEGAVVLVMRRLEDAERDGDNIYAVLRGIGGASDGKGKGITAPNPIGQQLAVEQAWHNAGLSPATMTMIEGHGTATRVGDVVEGEILTKVLADAGVERKIALGSVKSNIGHLKGAAGAAGILKAILSLREQVMPPSIGFEVPNPKIAFDQSPLRVNTELRPWSETVDGVRRAGVSAFGFGGTNFHAVLEEHIPNKIVDETKASFSMAAPLERTATRQEPASLHGAVLIGAQDKSALQERLRQLGQRARAGRTPEGILSAKDLNAPERIAIEFGDAAVLAKRADQALDAIEQDPGSRTWRLLRSRGIFRGSGAQDRVAFLFTGQGSQYPNMLAQLRETHPIVKKTFDEADAVMESLIGGSLSERIFVDPSDEDAVRDVESALKQTAITQPAVLTADVALTRLFATYGILPDLVMGHSLGEYAALVAAGVMPFSAALEAVSARGREMTKVSVADNGMMAAVFAPVDEVERILKTIDGYVVVANLNSTNQSVIGGSTDGVKKALAAFEQTDYRFVALPVSHAFHTDIVSGAAEPLRNALQRMDIRPPTIPVVSNVTGELYPSADRSLTVDLLARQVASPVQFVKGLHQLYHEGARVFVEVGPKRALQQFAENVFQENEDVLTISSNHPRVGDAASFNRALCGLYAAGHGEGSEPAPMASLARSDQREGLTGTPSTSVVITGASIGLPGGGQVFAEENVERILGGEQLIDVVPVALRRAQVDRRITRLVKSESGARFESIDSMSEVIKLAGRKGEFDLVREYGFPEERHAALDITTKLAMAAGLEALRDAGVPLAMQYKITTTGSKLPDRWMLPESMRDETGVIFASAFPGLDSFVEANDAYHEEQSRLQRISDLESIRDRLEQAERAASAASEDGWTGARPGSALEEVERRIDELQAQRVRANYGYDRRLLFRILSMGHAQFAEYVGARGPNTAVNAACTSGSQAISIAADWIKAGRCRRVIVLSADDTTSDRLMGWIGSGFLAMGAAATDEIPSEAALPFDRRRHGMILGMGATAEVVEEASAAQERGVRPICEVLGAEIANSAFHGSRLNEEHICEVLERLVSRVEKTWHLDREEIAQHMVFVSHETYTPARGGSASAEVKALRHVFGAAASQVLITNTKGLTGHAMGASIEDAVAIKVLETGIVPPVVNFAEVDPELGPLNLSKGGAHPVQYTLRLAAGFGSQVNMNLLRWVPSPRGDRAKPYDLGYHHRIDDQGLYDRWLAQVSGQDQAEVEVVARTLRIVDRGRTATPVAKPVVEKPRPAVTQPAVKPIPMEKAERPVAPPEPALVPVSRTSVFEESVANRVLAIVSEKTGYPPDMLEVDLDLEADLGIDTVKQAETFAAVRESYDIARDESIQLRSFPTIKHVIQFVLDHRGEADGGQVSAASVPQQNEQKETEQNETEQPEQSEAEQHEQSGVADQVLSIISEKTGYPPDMLEVELDLEADLGIDTVKQAETFAAVRETYDIPREESLQLRDFPTIEHVIQFVLDHRPDLAAVREAPPEDELEEVRQKVLQIISETTGYPPEMLEMDLDLEADLGIDTVKQAETFAAVREVWSIPRDENLKLRDFPTIQHLIGFVQEHRAHTATETQEAEPIEEAEEVKILRRVPIPVVRPPLAICKPTGVVIDDNSRVLVMKDQGGVSEALIAGLESRGAEVLSIDGAPDAETLTEQLSAWLEQGPIQGVYWLPALDPAASIRDLETAAWKELLRVRVKLLYRTMRMLDGFLISATRLGGCHGYDEAGAQEPLGGGVSGFTKALQRERASALVKVVDFERTIASSVIADRLIEETLHDPGAVELGYQGQARFTISVEERDASETTTLPLDSRSVFLVTGAAGSIVSAIVSDLASTGGTFHLVDLAPAPDPTDPDLQKFETDQEALKRELFLRIKASGERATPKRIEKEIAKLERISMAKNAIEAIQRAGGTAHYHQVDLLDAEAVEQMVGRIESERVDVLIHAAGLEISHFLPDKEPNEFDLVFDVKSDGWFHIMKALGDKPLGAAVVFSSVAGRFGNAGQTDYSAANDLLCKQVSHLQSSGETRGIAIDWSAWASIGMASRGSIPEMMARAGIDLVPPELGIPVVRRELTSGGSVPPGRPVLRDICPSWTSTEVVIGGRLGVLLEERDPTGGLDLDAFGAEQRLMNARILGMGVHDGLRVETELDPKEQPFLFDHQIDGTPVLPGVMGIEGFGEVAQLLFPDWSVSAVENINFLAPFKFYRSEPRTLTLIARFSMAGDNLVADCRLVGERLISGRDTAQLTTHFTATVQLTQDGIRAASTRSPEPPLGPTVDREKIYGVYFHGPAYQVLESAWRSNGHIVGRMPRALPENHRPQELETVMEPRLVELCFQTAGVWQIGTKGSLALPQHIDRISVVQPRDRAQGRLHAVVDPKADGSTFDAHVIDEAGNVYVTMTGYRTVEISNNINPEQRKPLQTAME